MEGTESPEDRMASDFFGFPKGRGIPEAADPLRAEHRLPDRSMMMPKERLCRLPMSQRRVK
jgi:hypothetical protein